MSVSQHTHTHTHIAATANSGRLKKEQNSQNKKERKCLIDYSVEGTHDRMNGVGERKEKEEASCGERRGFPTAQMEAISMVLLLKNLSCLCSY